MCEDTVERWKPVPGWEHYEVSDAGRVRSLRGLLKPWKVSGDYRQLRLYKDRKPTTFTVHTLVMLAFVGPRPDGLETRHLDSVPSHNCLINLVYGTRSENVMDEVRRGTHHRARKTHCPSGHPYSGDNLYLNPNKQDRRCRACVTYVKRPRNFPNERKTHCKYGHEYTVENTYRAPKRPTSRQCRECMRTYKQSKRKSISESSAAA